MNIEPVIGIVIGTDFIHRRVFGGTSGLVLSLIEEIGLHTRIFGVGHEGTIPWYRYQLNSRTSFQAVDRMVYPSKIPLRLQCLLSFWRQRQRILQSGVDILYIHGPEIAIPFLFGRGRLPVIFHQHGSVNPMKLSTYSWGRSIIYQKIYDLIFYTAHRRANWTIAIDQLCLEQARRHGSAHKSSLIMNAIDTKKFYPNKVIRNDSRKKLEIQNETRAILFVGRLEEIKRVDRIIASLEFLNDGKENGRYQLFIAGDGTLRRDLERLVIKQGLVEDVRFLGYVPHQELPYYYNMADVLVLPSEMEGVPMVILEALASGVPVVASRVGGIPDIIEDGINGITLEEVEAQSLSAAIQRVCERRYPPQEVAATVVGLSSARFAEALSTIIKTILQQEGKYSIAKN